LGCVVEVDLNASISRPSLCTRHMSLTCTNKPKYDHSSGISVTSTSRTSFPPGVLVPFCCGASLTSAGRLASSTFRAPLVGWGRMVRTPMAMASGKFLALRRAEMERRARRVKRGSKDSAALVMRVKLSMMTAPIC
jgi:hypothetical protein